GLVDENRVGVGNIEAGFDDRRGQEKTEFAPHESRHGRLQFVRGHLAVYDSNRNFWDNRVNLLAHRVDVMHAIVDEIDLASAIEFPHDRVANEGGIPTADAGFDWLTIPGWRH